MFSGYLVCNRSIKVITREEVACFTYGHYTAIEKHRAAVSVLRAEFYVVRNRQQGFPRTGQLLENLCKRNLEKRIQK